jgi:acetate kinase
MAILAVNAGSSSLKFSLHEASGAEVGAGLLTGNIEGLEEGGTPALRWSRGDETRSRAMAGNGGDGFAAALDALRALLADEWKLPPLQAVAHRVVHGGAQFRASVIVNDEVLGSLAKLESLAPLHQPHNLAGIRAFRASFPATPQVACFDTAFHASLPVEEYSFALTRELADAGVRRYGFHGLSYQYVMGELQRRSPRASGRVLMAHLGNGASVCAALAGSSRATTMGFSVLDGLMMGTRCGTLDPGVMLYLLEQGWDHDRLQKLLYRQSGLLGVSGISADMRHLRAEGSQVAHGAIDLFTHRVVRESGALTACLGGLDVLAFSGGIGEHDAVLREQVCAGLAYLGASLDVASNRRLDGGAVAAVHAAGSAVEIWVVPTDEGRVAAREAAALVL